jgi:D-alanine transaminase
MPAALASVQGIVTPLAEAKVPALDRGFLFGDAVYEVLRVYGSKPFLEKDHFDRLERSLASIGIQGVDLERVRRRSLELIAAGPFREATVYIQISRGAGAHRTHNFPKGATPLEFLFVEEYDDSTKVERRKNGVQVITHPDIRWGRCDIKSVNLLANCLAYEAAVQAGSAEALLILPDGTISEASHSSFFWVIGDTVYSTPLAANILPGITRKLLVELARKAGVPFGEGHLKLADLPRIDELFLSGTTSEVLPVVKVDGQTIGNGKPGPQSQKLLAIYQEEVRRFRES